jgi:hypothetical protein
LHPERVAVNLTNRLINSLGNGEVPRVIYVKPGVTDRHEESHNPGANASKNRYRGKKVKA